MSIFNKKFEDIDFSDIQALVDNKVNESQVLEYKERYTPKQTASLISAFANTYGGFIIYGIKEDEINNEPDEIINVNNDKLENTIDAVCYDSITPPIFCESKYLESNDKTKRVFVVKVPESDLTPHAIDNNSIVYIKVNAQKRRTEKATLEQQDWLNYRRLKSEKLRIKLIQDIQVHADNICESYKPKEFLLETFIVPQFPRQPLIKFSELYNFAYKSVNSFNYYNDTIISPYKSYQYNNGLVFISEDDKRNVRIYFELNCYGLCAIKYIFPMYVEPEANQKYLDISHLLNNLHTYLKLLLEINSSINNFGSVIVNCSLNNIQNTLLMGLSGISDSCLIDNRLEISTKFSKFNNDSIQFILNDFYNRLLFVYNTHNNIEKIVKEKISEILKSNSIEFKEVLDSNVLI